MRVNRTITSRRSGAVGVALVVTSLLAAACGSGSGSPATTGGSGGTGATSTSLDLKSASPGAGIPKATMSSSLHASLPAGIKSKGSITAAVDPSYAPDEFLAPDGSTIIGMDADLGLAIGQVLGVTVNLTKATFDTIIPGMVSGKYDLGDSSFTDTKLREKQVNFVDYFSAGEAFYVKSNSPASFNGLKSLCGHTVAVESGTTEESDAKAQGKTCKVTVSSFGNQNDANLAVSTGRAQVGFVDSQIAAYIAAQSSGQFKVSGTAINAAPYGIAVPKGTLDKAVLGAVKVLMSDGIYMKILKKWGVQAGAITTAKINGAIS